MHVLVVEDERKIAAYLKRALEEEGYVVDMAYTGREALDWADKVNFDLVILDIKLPEMDGFAVCRELRKRDYRAPLLMLTALDAIDNRVTGLDAGADDYITKPFALKELFARMRALARRASDSPRTQELQLADLNLNLLTRRVKRGGRFIDLTAKEYAILECLLREAGRVLTRTQIAEHVWSYEDLSHSNIIDVYIRNLRRKLDDPFEPKLIHTVRGAGYRLAIESEDETV